MINENDNQADSLNLQDLLEDDETDVLSEYLSLSIKTDGEDTKVSVTTVEDNPTTYSSLLVGVSCHDLQSLLEVNIDILNE